MTMNVLTAARRVVTNLSCSRGNLLVGMDGSRFVDMQTNIASLPLGYNHPKLVELMQQPEVAALAINRSATNLYPPEQLEELFQNTFPRMSPFGYSNPQFLFVCSTGSEAIETAMKLCARKRNATTFISFDGGFHGRTCGALSLTHTNPNWKRGFPTIDVLEAPFPTHEDDINSKVNVFKTLCDSNIAAVVIEPVQCEGGDRFTHSMFYRKIRSICTMYDIPLIVDEIQTNMGTGTHWAHSHWQLQSEPDVVVFGKKMQTAGLYAKNNLAPAYKDEYAYNSTWAGDPFRMMMFKTILETVESEGLYEKSSQAGNLFFNRIRDMSGIKNVRNINAFGAFDLVHMDRDAFLLLMQDNGVLFGGCGTNSVRVRPSLVFDDDTVDIVLNHLSRLVG